MPKKVKALVGLMLLSIVLSTLNALMRDKLSPLIGPMITTLLLFGLLSGDETTRSILMFFGWLGVIYGGFALLMLLIMMPQGLKEGVPQYIALFFTLATALGQSSFFVWCLKREDVIMWMRKRSPTEA